MKMKKQNSIMTAFPVLFGFFVKMCIRDSYAGVREDEVINELKSLSPTLLINTRDLMKPENEIKEMTERFMVSSTFIDLKSACVIASRTASKKHFSSSLCGS